MTNHVHLIVDPGDKPESLSLLMKRVAGRQTRYTNKIEKRTGSVCGKDVLSQALSLQRDTCHPAVVILSSILCAPLWLRILLNINGQVMLPKFLVRAIQLLIFTLSTYLWETINNRGRKHMRNMFLALFQSMK
jgi:hypothetical protein